MDFSLNEAEGDAEGSEVELHRLAQPRRVRRVILQVIPGHTVNEHRKPAAVLIQPRNQLIELRRIERTSLEPGFRSRACRSALGTTEQVDPAVVKKSLPFGQVKVNVVKGGLDVPAADGHDLAVIASAAVAVRFDLLSLHYS